MTMDTPISIENEEHLDEILTEHSPVVLECYTDNCGICASMEPVMGVLARTSDATVVTVNPRDHPDLVSRFEVTEVPLLILFVDGKERDRIESGFVGADEIRDWVESTV